MIFCFLTMLSSSSLPRRRFPLFSAYYRVMIILNLFYIDDSIPKLTDVLKFSFHSHDDRKEEFFLVLLRQCVTNPYFYVRQRASWRSW